MGWPDADTLRRIAGDLQYAQRSRANVWFAKRERSRHYQICRLGFRQQALAMDALSARSGGGAPVGKPVKLVLSRRMMFQTAGHRARTQQRMRLAATREGKLESLMQDYV